MILLRIVMTQEDCRNIEIVNDLWYTVVKPIYYKKV